MATAIEILRQKSKLAQKQTEMAAIVEEMNAFFDGLMSYQRLYFEDILPTGDSRLDIDLAEFKIKTSKGTIDCRIWKDGDDEWGIGRYHNEKYLPRCNSASLADCFAQFCDHFTIVE